MIAKKCTLSKQGAVKDLTTCLKSEEKALNLYRELLPLLTEASDKIKITKIIKDEQRHIELVKELMHLVKLYYKST